MEILEQLVLQIELLELEIKQLSYEKNKYIRQQKKIQEYYQALEQLTYESKQLRNILIANDLFDQQQSKKKDYVKLKTRILEVHKKSLQMRDIIGQLEESYSDIDYQNVIIQLEEKRQLKRNLKKQYRQFVDTESFQAFKK